MTEKLDVSVTVRAEVPGTRTFAVACEQDLSMADYENQLVVQRFVRDHMDDPAYRLSVVEMSPPHTGDNTMQQLRCSLLQAFSTFSDTHPQREAIDNSKTYPVYVVTFQSIDAKNPTIKVVSKIV